MPWILLPKNLLAHPVRTALTMGSIVVAIFLICFLRSVLLGLLSGVAGSAVNRLVVQSAVSLFVNLPSSYQGKISAVNGVDQACKQQWFGGIYREPSNFFAQFAVDHDRIYDTWPEIDVFEGDPADFQAQRTACIVGTQLAQRFGFKVGDRLPLQGTIFPLTSGEAWDFTVVGIYRSRSTNIDESTMFFRFDYLDDVLERGGAIGPRGSGVFTLRIAPGADAVAVAREVDALFENGPQRVQTSSEAEFQRQFVTMLGSVPVFLSSIGFGILFAIVLAVLNTMLMAARERTHDLGIVKALGFSDASLTMLFLAESLLLCLAGGAAGIALAVVSEQPFRTMLSTLMPSYSVTPETMAMGMAVAAGIGVLAGLVPAWQAGRLRCVDALRAEV